LKKRIRVDTNVLRLSKSDGEDSKEDPVKLGEQLIKPTKKKERKSRAKRDKSQSKIIFLTDKIVRSDDQDNSND